MIMTAANSRLISFIEWCLLDAEDEALTFQRNLITRRSRG